MLQINEVMAQLAELGVEVYVQDEKLKARALKGGLKPAVVELIKNNKESLLSYLSEQQSALQYERTSIKSLPREQLTFPTSYAQRRLWFIDQMDGGSSQYNMPSAMHVNGLFEIQAAEAAFKQIIHRHEALRTIFIQENDEPVQKIIEDVDFAIQCVNLIELPESEQQQFISNAISADSNKPFALDQDLMLRVSYFETSAQTGVLLFNMHHIASDGWSIGLLVNEFTALYRSFKGVDSKPLPELTIQYADYAVWQRKWLSGKVLKSQMDYWLKQLDNLPPLHGLPVDKKRPEYSTFKGSRHAFTISKESHIGLNQLAREHNVTLFMLLHAIFSRIIAGYANSTDVVIGTPVANRLQKELEPLIGFFANTIILRNLCEKDSSLAEYLSHIKQVNLDAQQNQDIPFEHLVERLKPDRSTAYNPLFQIVFSMNNTESAELELPDVVLTDWHKENEDSGLNVKFDLSLNVYESQQGLECYFDYSHDVFNLATIQRFAASIHRLIGSLLSQPKGSSIPFMQLPFLPESEERQLLNTFNQTYRTYPDKLCIHELFEQQVLMTPERTAVEFKQHKLSYQELNEKANQLAYVLKQQGAGPEQFIGICVDRSIDMLLCLLGILKSGSAYLPLDPKYPKDRLFYMLEDSSAQIVLTEIQYQYIFNEKQHTVLSIDSEQMVSQCVTADIANLAIDQEQHKKLAYTIYTSGSTGLPKGVLIEHRNTVSMLHWAKSVYSQQALSRVLASTSMCFDISVFEFFAPLTSGGCVVIVESVLSLTDQSVDVSLINSVPSAAKALLESNSIPASVKTVNLAGELLEQSIVDQLYKKGIEQVFDLYGPSEDTTYSTYVLREHNGVNSIGKPIDNTQAYVLDSHLMPLPLGSIGELYLGGQGVARGYLNQAKLTAARFIDNPFKAYSEVTARCPRFYRTGDLVRYNQSGDLQYMGRIDHQVKIRGFRVELGEIEQLLSSMKQVDQCLIVAHKNTQTDQRLVAYLVACDVKADQLELSHSCEKHLRSLLPEYMLPSQYIILPSMPLNANGKIDRTQLPNPDGELAIVDKRQIIQPRNAVEKKLLDIWSALLAIPAANISTDSHFFELGGHSLLSIRIISEIRKVLHHEVSIRDVFENPILSQLAHHISNASVEVSVHKSIEPLTQVEQPMPCSYAQERLWFIDKLTPNSHQYNMPYALQLKGAFNVKHAQKAFIKIIQRHQVLRTVFKENGPGVVQIVRDHIDWTINQYNLSDLTEAEKQSRTEKIIKKHAEMIFNLSSDSMLQVAYILTHIDEGSSDNHQSGILLVNMHHIASDGWSMGILINEFIQLYSSFCRQKTAELQALKIQYADYAYWQRNWLQKSVIKKQLSYWQKQLAELPQVHQLPLDYARPKLQESEGESYQFQLDQQVLNKLKTFANKNNMTVFMVIHAVFSLMLSRYSGQQDIIVGAPVANRLHADLEHLIGFFVNTLILRVDCSADVPIHTYLQHIRDVNLSAQAHQDIPFEHLVEHLNPIRTTSYNPLFQIMLTMDTSEQKELELPDVSIQALSRRNLTAKFDLVFNVSLVETGSENDKGLYCDFIYNRGLFKAESIQQMGDSFDRVLTALMSEEDGLAIGHLPVLGQRQVHHQLETLNQTTQEIVDLCAHQVFEQQVKLLPEQPAVVFNGDTVSYAELNKQANALAHFLIHQGVEKEELIGICIERSIHMMVAVIATLKAGAAYLPLDPSYPKSRLQTIIKESETATVLTQQHLRDMTAINGVKHICIETPAHIDLCNRLSKENPDIKGLNVENLAYVIFTSGSTGTPKGVMIEHKGVTSLAAFQKQTFKVSNKSRLLHFASLSFDGATWEWIMALLNGGCLYIADNDTRQDPKKLESFLLDNKITHLALPPAFLKYLNPDKEYSFHSLIVAGEAFDHNLSSLWGNKYNFYNSYGPSETTVCATLSAPLYKQPVNIGKAMPNFRLYVLNENKKLVPKGAIGELYIAGVGLARGYLKQPNLTAERFIEHRFENGKKERLYRTGDLVKYLPDDSLVFVGRIDNQIKIRGFRIELSEIEHQIKKERSVDAVHVKAYQRNEETLLCAYFTTKETLESSEQERLVDRIKILLNKELPNYMIPADFVCLQKLPLTVNGKIDHKALPDPKTSAVFSQDFTAPVTDTEKKLAKLWADLLNKRTVEIGKNSDFFELGGHSLLSIQLISQIRAAFGSEISVRDVFEGSELNQLATKIEISQRQTRPRIVKVDRANSQLLASYAQQRLYYIDQMEGNSAHYNMPSAFRISGVFDVDAAQWAFQQIIHKHEPLRTNFVNRDGRVFQDIKAHFQFRITQQDISHLSESDQENAISKANIENALTRFDLSQELMLRVKYLLLNENNGVLLFNMHHIASDGWSMGVLFQEFMQLYKGKMDGKEIELIKLNITYADYAQWQRNWLKGRVLDDQLEYWKAQLEGMPQVHNLPLKRPRPKYQSFNGAQHRFLINKQTLEDIEAIVRQHKSTLFMFVHAVFSVLLSRYSNHPDVIIGTPVANRVDQQLEPVIGYFINTLILRSDCSANPSFLDMLNQVKNINLDAQTNQDIPFEYLVDQLKPERNTSYSPLFQIMLSMDTTNSFEFKLPDVSFSPLKTDHVSSKFELMLSALATQEGLQCTFEYNTDIFSVSFIKQLSDSFQLLTSAVVANPMQPIDSFPLMNQKQQQKILKNLSNRVDKHVNQYAVHELFEQQVIQTPEAVAVIYQDLYYTYAELNTKANSLAAYLKHTISDESARVGVLQKRSADLLISILAVMKAGFSYVALEPSHPMQRIEYIIEDAALDLILVSETVQAQINHIKTSQLVVDSFNYQSYQSDLAAAVTANQQSVMNKEVYTLYTSGSTGMPKGVSVLHKNLSHYIDFAVEHYIKNKVVGSVVSSPLCFDATITTLLTPLCCGAYVEVLVENDESLNELKHKLFVSQVPLLFKITPAHLNALSDHTSERTQSQKHQIVIGGEQLSTHTVKKWKQQLLPNASFINEYGPTETVVGCSIYSIQDELQLEQLSASSVPIGLPIDNTCLYVLNSDRQVQPVGSIGELYIGGGGVALGYLNQQELTNQNFINNPFDAGRMYKTGDLVRLLESGVLEFVGRADAQVNIRGFRVELGEIEYQLTQMPEINEAAVITQNTKQGEAFLTAFITCTHQQDMDQDAIEKIKQQLAKKIPNYMIPRHIVRLMELPITANGKVDIKALRCIEVQANKSIQVLPKSSEQRDFIQVIADILELDADDLSMLDNFFEVGGSSLSLLKVINALKEKGIVRTIKHFYECANFLDICETMNVSSDVTPVHSLVRLNNNRQTNPLYLIHPLGGRVDCYDELAKHLEKTTGVYGVQAPFLYDYDLEFSSLLELAHYYASAILTHQVNGPYKLGGWSVGGLIAQKVAEVLQRKGKEVVYFIGIDSFMKMPYQPVQSDFKALCEVVAFIKGVSELSSDFFPENFQQLELNEQVDAAAQLLLVNNTSGIDQQQLKYGLKFGVHFFRAQKNLLTQPIKEKLTLIIAEKNTEKKLLTDGWQQAFEGETTFLQVEGRHLHLLEGESLKQIVTQIQADLAEQQS